MVGQQTIAAGCRPEMAYRGPDLHVGSRRAVSGLVARLAWPFVAAIDS